MPCTAQEASKTANTVNRQCHSCGLFVSFPIEVCLRLKKLGDFNLETQSRDEFPSLEGRSGSGSERKWDLHVDLPFKPCFIPLGISVATAHCAAGRVFVS